MGTTTGKDIDLQFFQDRSQKDFGKKSSGVMIAVATPIKKERVRETDTAPPTDVTLIIKWTLLRTMRSPPFVSSGRAPVFTSESILQVVQAQQQNLIEQQQHMVVATSWYRQTKPGSSMRPAKNQSLTRRSSRTSTKAPSLASEDPQISDSQVPEVAEEEASTFRESISSFLDQDNDPSPKSPAKASTSAAAVSPVTQTMK